MLTFATCNIHTHSVTCLAQSRTALQLKEEETGQGRGRQSRQRRGECRMQSSCKGSLFFTASIHRSIHPLAPPLRRDFFFFFLLLRRLLFLSSLSLSLSVSRSFLPFLPSCLPSCLPFLPLQPFPSSFLLSLFLFPLLLPVHSRLDTFYRPSPFPHSPVLASPMDDFFFSQLASPSFFSLFPDALAIVVRRIPLTNETLAILCLVNHECHQAVMPVLWKSPQLSNSFVFTPLQCIQSILTIMANRSLRPETAQMINYLDMSLVEETLYSTLPDTWLLTLLQNAPKLQYLCLSGKKTSSPFVQTQTFRKLGTFVHPGLETLDLSSCTDIREPGIKSLATFFPNLVTLNLSGTSGVTDTSLALIVDRCQYLETLDLSYCRLITDLGLFAVAKFCRRNLRVLKLTGNLKITDVSLLAVAKHCPRIKQLCLGECSQITDSALEWIAKSSSSTSLTELELHRCDKVKFGLPLLELLSNKCIVLERITLTYKQINSRRDDLKLVMEAFRDFKQLKTIDIYEVPEFSPALFFWDLAFQGSRGTLECINLYRGSFSTDYILGNYAVAFEHDQHISDQTVRKFNEWKNGHEKAKVHLFVDDFY